MTDAHGFEMLDGLAANHGLEDPRDLVAPAVRDDDADVFADEIGGRKAKQALRASVPCGDDAAQIDGEEGMDRRLKFGFVEIRSFGVSGGGASGRAFQLVEVAGKRAVQINGHAIKETRNHSDGRPYRRRHESPRPNAFYYRGDPCLTASRHNFMEYH